MTGFIASYLVRMYPRTWRMRYEEEIRALLEDSPPTWRDIAGLASAAVTERVDAVADPIAHPIVAALITKAGGWFATALVISVTARAASYLLETRLGAAPEWAGIAGVVGTLIVAFRALPAAPNVLVDSESENEARVLGIRLAPLSAGQLRRWWAALWLSVVLISWADPAISATQWSPPIWFGVVILLRLSSAAAWQRARATTALRRLRRELDATLAERRRLTLLKGRGLASPAEVDAASEVITRINVEVREAARSYRTAALRRLPPDRPLGL